ncbi:MAG: ABC transporter ATP-binding protein [Natronomonas sp.]|uniref:ABC transporter ATP-binding protein n=1 Tax=Natronomonas sp. TaxID=2184060 RepID=UPI002870A4C3|nr:ABC transporter ATP-binding protein [Natronomonas sp.]MDR9431716.1 ABC transporter ATP-binding protein [Natronomonas sp.]
MSSMLSGENITKRYGGLVALDDVSFEVEEGVICGLVGPNGAGKTTLLNILTGREEAKAGRVVFDGEGITGLPPDQICRRGLVKTNQIVRPFGNMTVTENIAVAAVWGDSEISNMAAATEKAEELVDFVGLEEFATAPAGRLTHTPNRRLELARALATNPQMLLLDEAAAGLTSEEIPPFLAIIRSIRDDLGVTLFWIEHVMEAVMDVADQVVVLNFGEIIAKGTPEEVTSDEDVQKAYLGGGVDA